MPELKNPVVATGPWTLTLPDAREICVREVAIDVKGCLDVYFSHDPVPGELPAWADPAVLQALNALLCRQTGYEGLPLDRAESGMQEASTVVLEACKDFRRFASRTWPDAVKPLDDEPVQSDSDPRMRKDPAELSTAALLAVLAYAYRAEPIPPCRICGERLSVQSLGGGSATVWACGAYEDDPEKPGHLRPKAGRGISDEHYAQSRWVQYREGDARVRELVERVQALNGGRR